MPIKMHDGRVDVSGPAIECRVRMLRLVQILIETGNAEELNRIAADKKYREQQYKKNGLL